MISQKIDLHQLQGLLPGGPPHANIAIKAAMMRMTGQYIKNMFLHFCCCCFRTLSDRILKLSEAKERSAAF
jgi:hypothetical protein